MNSYQNDLPTGRMFTKELATNLNPFGNHNRLSRLSLYIFYFDAFPNTICESNIVIDNFLKAFHDDHGHIIQDVLYNKVPDENTGESGFEGQCYILRESMLLYVNYDDSLLTIYFKGEMSNTVKIIHDLIMQCKKEKDETIPKINILTKGSRGLVLEELELRKCSVSATEHYNDDFAPIDMIIRKRLSSPKDKGMVLLHGIPGTGKTHYIKYLMTHVNKKIIFISPDMADQLTNPSLISIFIDNPNSILVIEDAEKIIMDREVNGNSPVSAILNLSDGILADCLNIQIICSFNTDVSRIDKALLRKGRLIAKYEFGKLETSKANTLSRKLGFSTIFYKPQVLTDIFNQQEQQFVQKSKKAIGFN